MSDPVPPAGLYVHVPFCARVCPYCDFAVRTGDRMRIARYANRLVDEIELWAASDFRGFDTVYFGGGTPSRLAAEELSAIVERIDARLGTAARRKVYLEVNPEDVTRRAAESWRAAGVETISLGVQSLSDDGLAFLGRAHDTSAAVRAVEIAHETGFATVSVDLIYGLPGQTPAAWRRELERAVGLLPDHLSCYQLTVHERTRFGLLEKRGRLVQLSNDAQGELFRVTHRSLADAGYESYEVSQFSRAPEHRSRHNRKYWDHTPYLGLGPSAHSFRNGRRWWNLRRTDPWETAVVAGRRPIEGDEVLSPTELCLEALMTGLRTAEGVDLRALEVRWGVGLVAANGEWLERLTERGLVRTDGTRVRPTLEGLAVADSVATGFRIAGEKRSAKT